MKKIAKNESELGEVIGNLTDIEKIVRVKVLYDADEVLEILGYYDESMDTKDIEFIDTYPLGVDEAGYLLAIINGNFELAIAMNKRLGI